MRFPSSSGSGSSIENKTSTEMWALTGDEGQIIYNTTYGAHFAYMNGRWLPVGNIAPRSGFLLYDEFLSNTSSGTLTWTVSATVQAIAGTDTTAGVFVIRHATASNKASINLQTNGTVLGSMDLYIEGMVRFPTLATVSEDYCVAFGLNDLAAYNANSLATDGVYFTYNRGVNGANWNTHTVSNSTATNTTDIVSAIVANTWYRLGILIKDSTSAEFYVDGTLVATHTTNIPTGTARATMYQLRLDKVAGTGNSDVQIDYFMTYGFFNSTRVS